MLTFPFKTFRKGQKEALTHVQHAFDAGKRFVVLEAPTGAGKSAIAVALARAAKSSYLLTAQKLLQDQYLRDFSDLSLMKGRANYPCLIAPTHAAAAPCVASNKLKLPECDECPYFVQKDIAIHAPMTVMNYAYYLTELNYAGGFSERELLILDEAHNAEGALMNFIQVQLSDSGLKRVGLSEQIPSFTSEDEQYFDYADDLISILKKRSSDLSSTIKNGNLPTEIAIDTMHHKQWCDSQYRRLRQLSHSREEEGVEWVVEKRPTRDGLTLAFKPVTVAPFTHNHLFHFSQRTLMMSATILDYNTYLRSLGIKAEEAVFVQVHSDFPAENRPIYIKNTSKMTRHYLDQALPKISEEISHIMDSHSNQKGIIHAHTYKIARAIEQALPPNQRARLITHYSSEGRDQAIEKHTQSPLPTVLLSPSMTEGLDLSNDLSRWQVICKIPYPYLGDPQIARRRELDPAWYDWLTALSVVQAYGRSVRSRDDYAITYVLDADFTSFVKRQSQRLPQWFQEAIIT